MHDIVSYRLDKYETRDSDWLLTGDAHGQLLSGNFRCSVAQFLMLPAVAQCERRVTLGLLIVFKIKEHHSDATIYWLCYNMTVLHFKKFCLQT